jgi:hypothetical protein
MDNSELNFEGGAPEDEPMMEPPAEDAPKDEIRDFSTVLMVYSS